MTIESVLRKSGLSRIGKKSSELISETLSRTLNGIHRFNDLDLAPYNFTEHDDSPQPDSEAR